VRNGFAAAVCSFSDSNAQNPCAGISDNLEMKAIYAAYGMTAFTF
jgi:hypothetical protein